MSTTNFAKTDRDEFASICHIDEMWNELKTARKNRKMTLERLSEASGLSVSVISRLEKGQRKPNMNHIDALARGLKCDKRDLIAPVGVRIPIVGKVSAGEGVNLVDAYEKGEGHYFIDAPADLDPRRYIAVQIEGDSMSPVYPDKGVAIFRREFEGVHPDAVNALAIVCTDDDEAMFKKVAKGREQGTFDLISLNPKTETRYDMRLRWAAPISRFIYPTDSAD